MVVIKTLPFKLAVILLGLFQIYMIYKNSANDIKSNLIPVLILLGCIILIVLDVFFKKNKSEKTR